MPGVLMVGTEIALAVMLLVGGGLLLRSLLSIVSRDLGFDPDDVVVLDIALTAPEYRDLGTRMTYWDRLLEGLRADPGVVQAGLGNWIPTGGGGTSFIELYGLPDPNGGAGYRVVSDGYFDAMGIPLLQGRRFDRGDALGTERVGLVNQAAARAFWPDEDPLGKRIKAPSMEAYYNGGTADWITVVGVVGDVRHYGPESDPRPELFVLHRQMPGWTGYMSAVVKVRPGASATLPASLRQTARDLDKRLPVQVATLAQRVQALLSERKLIFGVLATFAASALLLVCLGIYGLVSFAVSARTREIAVRTALGAQRGGIMAMVLGDAGRVALAGAAVGLLLALLLRRALDAMVVGVSTTDPVTYVGAAVLVMASALAAAFVPSIRAARLDPLKALTKD
jgi:predicted permease